MIQIDFFAIPPYHLKISCGENWVALPWITYRDVYDLLGPEADHSSSASVHMANIIVSYMLEVGISSGLIEEAMVSLVQNRSFVKELD